MKPKVSIVIPTFNRLGKLPGAVKSVLSQKFSDWELIICDNHSDDGTHEWVSKLCKKDKRVRYHRNLANLGMVENWNVGVTLARGEYVSLLMSDDRWDKSFLSESVEILDLHEKVGMVVVRIIPFQQKLANADYGNESYRFVSQDRMYLGSEAVKSYLKGDWLMGLPSAVLSRKSGFLRWGLFDEVGLDPEMWLRRSQSEGIYYLDRPLCFWDRGDGQTFSSSGKNVEYYFRLLRIIEKVVGYNFEMAELVNIRRLGVKARARVRRELLRVAASASGEKKKEMMLLYSAYSSGISSVNDLTRIGLELLKKRIRQYR